MLHYYICIIYVYNICMCLRLHIVLDCILFSYSFAYYHQRSLMLILLASWICHSMQSLRISYNSCNTGDRKCNDTIEWHLMRTILTHNKSRTTTITEYCICLLYGMQFQVAAEPIIPIPTTFLSLFHSFELRLCFVAAVLHHSHISADLTTMLKLTVFYAN